MMMVLVVVVDLLLLSINLSTFGVLYQTFSLPDEREREANVCGV